MRPLPRTRFRLGIEQHHERHGQILIVFADDQAQRVRLAGRLRAILQSPIYAQS